MDEESWVTALTDLIKEVRGLLPQEIIFTPTWSLQYAHNVKSQMKSVK